MTSNLTIPVNRFSVNDIGNKVHLHATEIWLRRAAEKGHLQSQGVLGEFFNRRLGRGSSDEQVQN